MNQTKAYAKAYGLQTVSRSVPSDLLRENPNITERVREIQAVSAGKTVLSLAEKRDFLASVVRTPIGQITSESPLAQSRKTSTRTNRDGQSIVDEELKVPCKLRALELDARLAGELDNVQIGVSVAVGVLDVR